MLSISADKIDSLFELIGSKQPLYLPVDNTSGKADFKKWEKGVKLSSALKTVRSAKDFFFPKTEHMVSYKVSGKEIGQGNRATMPRPFSPRKGGVVAVPEGGRNVTIPLNYCGE